MSQESSLAGEQVPEFDTRRATAIIERSRQRIERQQKRHLRTAALTGTVLTLMAFAGAAERAGFKFPTRSGEQGSSRATVNRVDTETAAPPAAEQQGDQSTANSSAHLRGPESFDAAGTEELQAEVAALEVLVGQENETPLVDIDYPPIDFGLLNE